MHDGIEHPDLAAIGGSLRARFDAVLEAERRAALVAARRGTTLRDRLLELEDEGGRVALRLGDDGRIHGTVTVTAADHLEIRTPGGRVLVPIRAVTAIELG